MVSPKSTARQQGLEAKRLNGHTASEDMEYKKPQVEHDVDVLALNELRWKVELAEAIMISSMNNSSTKSALDDVIQSEIDEEQKPHSWKDIVDLVNVFLIEAKQEVTTQNRKQSLGSNPSDNNGLPDGLKHNN